MVVDPAELGSNNWSTHMSNLINLGLWIDVAKKFEIETTILTEIVDGNETRVLVARKCPEHIFNAMKILK